MAYDPFGNAAEQENPFTLSSLIAEYEQRNELAPPEVIEAAPEPTAMPVLVSSQDEPSTIVQEETEASGEVFQKPRGNGKTRRAPSDADKDQPPKKRRSSGDGSAGRGRGRRKKDDDEEEFQPEGENQAAAGGIRRSKRARAKPKWLEDKEEEGEEEEDSSEQSKRSAAGTKKRRRKDDAEYAPTTTTTPTTTRRKGEGRGRRRKSDTASARDLFETIRPSEGIPCEEAIERIQKRSLALLMKIANARARFEAQKRQEALEEEIDRQALEEEELEWQRRLQELHEVAREVNGGIELLASGNFEGILEDDSPIEEEEEFSQ